MDCLLPIIFEYLSSKQIWTMQALNKTIQKMMLDHVWETDIRFGQKISDRKLREILSKWKLTKINLCGCRLLTTECISDLGKHKFIRTLNLCDTNTTDICVSYLTQCEKLHLCLTQITDECVKYITKCKTVYVNDTQISLQGMKYLTERGVIVG